MSPAVPASGAAAPLATLAGALPEGMPAWILVVSLMPVALVLLTSFARISIALAFLRHGLGLPDVIPGTVSAGLAALLACVTMAPVIDGVYQEALVPLSRGEVTGDAAVAKAWGALRGFLEAQTRGEDLGLIRKLYAERGSRVDARDPRAGIPAFVLSELKSGFQIGLILWIPFLVVDLLVALILAATTLPLETRTVALPLKLTLFVTVDGWSLLTAGLVRSFGGAP